MATTLSPATKSAPDKAYEHPAPTSQWRYWLAATFFGALVGMAAPGLEQWYLPWLGMTALLALSLSARDNWQAAMRGMLFGMAYNLVYLNWLLTFRAAYCDGVFSFCPTLIGVAFWIMLSSWQGLGPAAFACLSRALPLTHGWLPVKHRERWHLPSFICLPLLFVLVDRLFNTTQLLGFPWSSLHYTQYKQLPLLQIASIIGGVGISAWIILVNANILALLSAATHWNNPLNFSSRRALTSHTAISALLSLLFIAFGANRLTIESHTKKKEVLVTAIQSGLCERVHKLPVTTVVQKYLDLAKASPKNSVVIWPEWSIPLGFTANQPTFKNLALLAKQYQQSWVVGVFDRTKPEEIYNSVCAMTASGRLIPAIYHKRYLVPVGEFTPSFIRDTPVSFALYGPDKKYHDTSSGSEATVFDVDGLRVAPLLCFESFHPKLSTDSVKAGGELLADSSNNSWFRLSILSDQMVSFSVMRAVENHRSFVFATALGPSTIIDSTGHILKQAGREQEGTISARVPVETDLTPYTRWCF